MKRTLLICLVTCLSFTYVQGAGNSTIDGHEYVDLGLPSGSLWATVNYGAQKPEGYGTYYSNGTKISGWGEKWTTPTKNDFQELIDECEWTWTTINNVNGYSIKGKNGKTMFLPAAGKAFAGLPVEIQTPSGLGSKLYYITSTVENDFIHTEYYFEADASTRKISSDFVVIDEMSVRPIVKEKKATGITDVKTLNDEETKFYDLNGIETNENKKGIVIIKTKDGRTKKVFQK